MDELEHPFVVAARHGIAFRDELSERSTATPDLASTLAAFAGDLPDDGCAPNDVISELVDRARPNLASTPGPRFFGFVTGGALESATAAEILTSGWDQCGYSTALSPVAAAVEEAAGGWLKDLLGLPATSSVGFVTGGQAGNTVGLASGRHHVLTGAGWNLDRDGLWGAPRLRIVAGAERHATIDRAARLLGLGTGCIDEVAVDGQGAIDVDDLARVLAAHPAAPTIVCLQAGNVNTGAFDSMGPSIDLAHRIGAWVHVDGAFGLWAAASPSTASLVSGIADADSWSCDGHKWLNVPYDSGYVFVSRPEVHRAAVSYTAAYLTGSGADVPRLGDLTLESSRRARGFATWAALRELGRLGVADLVDRCCAHARLFADRLGAAGVEIGNEVVLNQVLARFGDDDRTDRVVEGIQGDGTCWMGATTWQGRRYMRIAVSNATTTVDDVHRSVAAILRIAATA